MCKMKSSISVVSFMSLHAKRLRASDKRKMLNSSVSICSVYLKLPGEAFSDRVI